MVASCIILTIKTNAVVARPIIYTIYTNTVVYTIKTNTAVARRIIYTINTNIVVAMRII